MRQLVAAIRSGSDPVVPLPPAAFHRWLEDPIYCPKCEATYFLVVDFDWAVSHYFEQESRRHIALLRKTVFLGHAHGHLIPHFQTNGVEVTRHAKPEAAEPLASLPSISRHIH